MILKFFTLTFDLELWSEIFVAIAAAGKNYHFSYYWEDFETEPEQENLAAQGCSAGIP